MRKTILFYISIAAAAVLMASLSAYLIDSDTAANNFRIGTNTIEAKEEFYNTGHRGDYGKNTQGGEHRESKLLCEGVHLPIRP